MWKLARSFAVLLVLFVECSGGYLKFSDQNFAIVGHIPLVPVDMKYNFMNDNQPIALNAYEVFAFEPPQNDSRNAIKYLGLIFQPADLNWTNTHFYGKIDFRLRYIANDTDVQKTYFTSTFGVGNTSIYYDVSDYALRALNFSCNNYTITANTSKLIDVRARGLFWKVDYDLRDLIFGLPAYMTGGLWDERIPLLSKDFQTKCPTIFETASDEIEQLARNVRVDIQLIHLYTTWQTRLYKLYAFNTKSKTVIDVANKFSSFDVDSVLPSPELACGDFSRFDCSYFYTCEKGQMPHCSYDCRQVPFSSEKMWWPCSESYNMLAQMFPPKKISHLPRFRRVLYHATANLSLSFRCPIPNDNTAYPIEWRIFTIKDYADFNSQFGIEPIIREIFLRQSSTTPTTTKQTVWAAISAASLKRMNDQDLHVFRCRKNEPNGQIFMNYYVGSFPGTSKSPIKWCILFVDGEARRPEHSKKIYLDFSKRQRYVTVECRPYDVSDCGSGRYGRYYLTEFENEDFEAVLTPNVDVQYFGRTVYRSNQHLIFDYLTGNFQEPFHDPPYGVAIEVEPVSQQNYCKTVIGFTFGQVKLLPSGTWPPTGVYTVALYRNRKPSELLYIFEFEVAGKIYEFDKHDFNVMGSLFPAADKKFRNKVDSTHPPTTEQEEMEIPLTSTAIAVTKNDTNQEAEKLEHDDFDGKNLVPKKAANFLVVILSVSVILIC